MGEITNITIVPPVIGEQEVYDTEYKYTINDIHVVLEDEITEVIR